jgi:hypothetical protein
MDFLPFSTKLIIMATFALLSLGIHLNFVKQKMIFVFLIAGGALYFSVPEPTSLFQGLYGIVVTLSLMLPLKNELATREAQLKPY